MRRLRKMLSGSMKFTAKRLAGRSDSVGWSDSIGRKMIERKIRRYGQGACTG
ncbi:hypothetical protein CBFG_05828 [Clostridiales bacterium 1_7_47FAA]|nr:hypothetical protein CBFG_05828 [Clostridiales bacterium 1_7_47FAA]